MDTDPSGPQASPPDDDDRYEPRSRSWVRLVAVVVVLGLIGLFALRPSRNASEGPVAAFTLTGLRDSDPDLGKEDLVGRAVVINFWASWCIPCRREMPMIERAWQTYGPQGLLVVGVDVMDAPRNALDFLEEIDVSYPIVTDPSEALTGRLEVTGLPQTLFVPPDEGALDAALRGDFSAAELVLGELTEERLADAIETILHSVAE